MSVPICALTLSLSLYVCILLRINQTEARRQLTANRKDAMENEWKINKTRERARAPTHTHTLRDKMQVK